MATKQQEINLVVPESKGAYGFLPSSDEANITFQPAMFRWPGHDTKTIKAGALQKGLDDIQAQIDGVLGKVAQPKVPSFQLKTVDISLAITAEGSVGIATAGVQASLTLSFDYVPGK